MKPIKKKLFSVIQKLLSQHYDNLKSRLKLVFQFTIKCFLYCIFLELDCVFINQRIISHSFEHIKHFIISSMLNYF